MSKSQITFSERTKLILANYSKISPSIFLHKGNVIRTLDSTGGVMAKATIEEELPFNFPVGNLKGLLQTINLSTFKNSVIEMDEDKMTLVAGNNSLDYYATDEDSVESIDEDVTPDGEINFTFDIDNDTMSDLKSAAKSMGLPFVKIESVNGKVEMKAYNPDLPTSTVYTIVLQDKSETVDFMVEMKLANLQNIIDGNYTVQVAEEDGYNIFTAVDGNLEYIIGHEEGL